MRVGGGVVEVEVSLTVSIRIFFFFRVKPICERRIPPVSMRIQASPPVPAPTIIRSLRWRPSYTRLFFLNTACSLKTLSGQFFWDPDEEGEVFIPPQEGGIKPTNPIKVKFALTSSEKRRAFLQNTKARSAGSRDFQIEEFRVKSW